LGLWLWINSLDKRGWKLWIAPITTAVGLGLSIQSEIFLAYHIIPIAIWLYVARKGVLKKQYLVFITTLLATISSMIVVEFKFGFQSIGGITNLVTSGDSILNSKNFGDFIILYLNQLGEMFSNNLFPFNAGYGGFIGVVMLFLLLKAWVRKKRKKIVTYEPFLATYVLSHLPIVSMGGVSTPFLLVGIGGGAIILTSVTVYLLGKINKIMAIVLCLVVILSNIITVLMKSGQGQVIFAIQKDMLLSNELNVLDYIYKASKNKPFSINTITSPLWINTTWSYLFNWYGKGEYGYLPEWGGRDQVGQLGNNLENANTETNLHYLIIEPPQGIPGYYLEWEQNAENSKSEVINEASFGDIRVQQRSIKNNE
jgi:hypothetical protein